MINRYVIAYFLAILVCFLVYTLNFSDAFIYEFDDDWLILNNPSITEFSLKNIYHLVFTDIHDLSYQPLMYISLSLDIKLFGYDAYLMKVHNLLIHLLSGTLIFYFLNRITNNIVVSFWAACIFLIHPIQVENIAWSVCRRQVLFEFYFILSLIIYFFYTTAEIKLKKRIYFLLFLFSTTLAFLAKYTSFIILPTIILMDIYIHKIPLKQLLNQIQKRVGVIIGCLTIIAVFTYQNTIATTNNSIDLVRKIDYSTFQFALISLKSFTFYLEKTIFPFNFSPYYPEAQEGIKSFPAIYYLYLIISLSIIFLFIYFYLKERFLTTFLLGAYLVNTAVASTRLFLFSDLTWNNADRYFYGASPFIFFLIVHILYKYAPSYKIFSLVMITICCILLYSTSFQVKYWKNSITLFSRAVELYPSSEFYRRLACVQMLYGENALAYQNLNNSKNCNLQNNVNVTAWTHLQTAYIYLVNNDLTKANQELFIAMDKDQLSDYQKKEISKLFTNNSKYQFKEFIKQYYSISNNQMIKIL